ncbi:hypothetical protein C0995_003418 [Termitomyces sp. Mi166|nr:hypothetical protein C0995_003418 [Termitomyces sp. Mi166\
MKIRGHPRSSSAIPATQALSNSLPQVPVVKNRRLPPIPPQKRAPSVPFELLVAIFGGIAGNSTQGLSLPPNIYETAWTLTRVCSQWRRVALSMSCLWNNLNIHVSKELLPGDFYYLKILLPAKGPLFFTLSSEIHHDNLIDVFVRPYLHRLKRLHLNLPIPSFAQFWTLTPDSLRTVSDMSIQFHKYDHNLDISIQLEDITTFRYPDDLRSLTLAAYDANPAGLNASEAILWLPYVPWARLTYLNLGYGVGQLHWFTLRQIHDILKQCVSLQTFATSLRKTSNRSIVDNELNIPNLTSVKVVHGSSSGSICDLLVLDLPWYQLTDLSLRTVTSLRSIFAILHHTPSLKTLCLGCNVLGPNVIPNAPLHLPFLWSLTLYMDNYSILPLLELPRLSEFRIRPSSQSVSIVHPFPAETILEFLLRSGSVLQRFKYDPKISLSFMPDEQDEALQNLFAAVPNLQTFSAKYLHLGRNLLNEIAQRSLLPRLMELETNAVSPDVFASAVERRVRYGHPRLMFARGYYSTAYYTPPGLEKSCERLQLLNLQMGTDCKLQKF